MGHYEQVFPKDGKLIWKKGIMLCTLGYWTTNIVGSRSFKVFYLDMGLEVIKV
jgi:hypothetical protein